MKMKITNIDDVEVELTICMSLRDWREFEAQLRGTNYPSGCLGDWIAEKLGKFNQATGQDGDA